MIRRGWLADTDISLLEAQVMRFFHANDLADVPYVAHAAKKADYSKTTAVQLAWLYRVRQIASEMVTPNYSEKKLRELIASFPRFMIDPEEMRHIPKALYDCGIRFVVVETLPKANIDGVCFWLDAQSPVVGMTVRHDRIDNFWFVLRHELEHVLCRHGMGALSADQVDVDIENTDTASLSEEEQRANEVAADFCLPQNELESFYVRKYPFISERDMLGFARRVQRHPGIVVGQLQHKMQRFDWLSRHKIKIRTFLLGNATVDGWGVSAPASL